MFLSKTATIIFLKGDLRMNILIYIAKILVIVGALNWGLVGILDFDLIEKLFGHMSAVSRILYTLVGLSAVFLIAIYFIQPM